MTSPRSATVEALLRHLSEWAATESELLGILLVGSYASGEAEPGSDIDLVVISETPSLLISDEKWIGRFGEVTQVEQEDWGKVQSIRVRYSDGLEVEFGVAGHDWLRQPIDESTAEVLRKGAEIVFDRDGYLAARLADHTIRHPKSPSEGDA